MANDPDISQSTALVPAAEGAVTTAPPIATMVEAEVLTPEETKEVEALANEIKANFDDFNYRSTFGAKAQEEVAAFSEAALGNTRVYQTGAESRKLIGEFRNHMEDFRDSEKRGPGLLAKVIGEVKWWTRQFEQVETFIARVKQQFNKRINELTVDLNVNTKALEVNVRSRRALIVHIRAAKQALEWARTVKLAELQAKAEQTKALGDIEAARDFSKHCDDFELKIGRLDSSLAITYIRKPEIDVQRSSEELSISLLHDILTQAIPIWVEDMRIGMGNRELLQSAGLAAETQNMTNEMFLSTIDRLGEAAESTIKVVGRGTVDTPTIIAGTDKLLATLARTDAAFQEEVAKARQYEQDRAVNNAKIKDFLAKAGSSKSSVEATPAV